MFTRTGSCNALLSSDRDFRQRSPTHSCKMEHMQKGTTLFTFKNKLGIKTKPEEMYRLFFVCVCVSFLVHFVRVQAGCRCHLSIYILTCWQIVFKTYFAYTSKLAVSMETLPPSDMSSRPDVCESPEPLSSASPEKNHITYNISSTQIQYFQSHMWRKSDRD